MVGRSVSVIESWIEFDSWSHCPVIIAESPDITEMNKLSLLESDANKRNILTRARAGK